MGYGSLEKELLVARLSPQLAQGTGLTHQAESIGVEVNYGVGTRSVFSVVAVSTLR